MGAQCSPGKFFLVKSFPGELGQNAFPLLFPARFLKRRIFGLVTSLAVASNIFVGNVESPLVVRPYLGEMTRSELAAVMTAGFATIAGSVMAAYIGFGVDAGHLLSASVMRSSPHSRNARLQT